MFSKAKRCILISGTPMLARPAEIYNLLYILRPDIFQDFEGFTERFCAPKKGRYGLDYTGKSCTSELYYIINKNLMIRRLKVDVLHELPSKRR